MLHEKTMAVDAEQREVLETYAEVVNFLLRTYATDEVFFEAVGDVTFFLQSSNMTEEVYSNQLWDKALCCGIVILDRHLKSFFVEGARNRNGGYTVGDGPVADAGHV